MKADSDSDLDGLRGFGVVEGDVFLGWSVSDLSALRCLTSVEGSLEFASTALVDLEGLEHLANVRDNLVFGLSWDDGNDGWSNEVLTSIDALGNLSRVGGSLFVLLCPKLLNLDGLSQLRAIGGDVVIEGNRSLASLEGLKRLRHVPGRLSVSGNPALEDVNGLRNIAHIGKSLELEDAWFQLDDGEVETTNASLVNLDGLSDLTEVEGDVTIAHNDVLQNIDGLTALTTVGGGVSIAGNRSLEDVNGLRGLSTVAGVTLSSCPALTHLEGLSNLQKVTTLSLLDLELVASLVPLRGLEDVGYLEIDGCPGLLNLDGLEGPTSLERLKVTGNAELRDLRALSSLERVGEFWIADNSQLSTCEAEWLLDNIGIANVDREITIYGNLGACP